MEKETAPHEPQSEDVKRALLRQEHQKEADKVKQEAANVSELKKIKSGETKYNYVAIFETEAGQDILDDLKEFCFYDKPLYDDDQKQMFRNVIKNEVIHYILERIGEVNIVAKPTPSPFPKPEVVEKVGKILPDPIPEAVKKLEDDYEVWHKFYVRKIIDLCKFKPRNKE